MSSLKCLLSALIMGIGFCPRGTLGADYTQIFSVGLNIPDDSSTGLSDTKVIVGTPNALINSVRISLDVGPAPGSEGFLGDLYAYVEHDNVFVTLLDRPGRRTGESAGYDDNQEMNVLFDDLAPNNIHNYRNPNSSTPLAAPLTGAWKPDGRVGDPDKVLASDPPVFALDFFGGDDPTGAWTFFIADLSGGNVHRLVSWGLEITTDVSFIPEADNWVAAGIFALVTAVWWRRPRHGSS